MPNHFSIDINKRPFYLAGQKVEAIAFSLVSSGYRWALLAVQSTGTTLWAYSFCPSTLDRSLVSC
jgi:hypothetical protein